MALRGLARAWEKGGEGIKRLEKNFRPTKKKGANFLQIKKDVERGCEKKSRWLADEMGKKGVGGNAGCEREWK